LWKII
jgi:hypothetical protein